MTAPKIFPQAECLTHLEQLRAASTPDNVCLPAWLEHALASQDRHDPAKIVDCLVLLLTAGKAVWQAACDTTLAADELRRYQKFARPGQPTAHIVQLRQKQAAARQASSIARQAFVRAATAFARETGLDVPQRVALEAFVGSWIDTHVPRSATPAQ
jgi:hypothetical protein